MEEPRRHRRSLCRPGRARSVPSLRSSSPPPSDAPSPRPGAAAAPEGRLARRLRPPAPPRRRRRVLFHAGRTRPVPRGALVYATRRAGSSSGFRACRRRGGRGLPVTGAEAFAAGRRTGRALHRPASTSTSRPCSTRRPGRSAHVTSSRLDRRRLRAGSPCERRGRLREALPGPRLDRDLDRQPPAGAGVVRANEVAGFRAAVVAGVPCVMVSHARYRRFGPRPAVARAEGLRALASDRVSRRRDHGRARRAGRERARCWPGGRARGRRPRALLEPAAARRRSPRSFPGPPGPLDEHVTAFCASAPLRAPDNSGEDVSL